MSRILEPVIVLVAALALVAIVHAGAGDERAVCAGDPCAIGSGLSWLATGSALVTPPLVWAGVAWARRLDRHGDLGPFADRAIPDIEEIAEGVWFVAAVLLSYLIIRNGPTIPTIDPSWPNSWLDGRLGVDQGRALVPARRTWFVVGCLLAMPVAFSAGNAAGREWYGRWGAFSAEVGEDRVE